MNKNIIAIDLVLLVGTLIVAAIALFVSTQTGVQFSPLETQEYLHAFSDLPIYYSGSLESDSFVRVVIGQPFVLSSGTYYFESGGEIVQFDVLPSEVTFVIVEEQGRYLLRVVDEDTLHVEQTYLGEYQRDFSVVGGNNA